jgi:hypothetical protein
MSNLILAIFCFMFAVIPEVALYFLYPWIAPTSSLAKAVVLAMFWCGGLGLCVLFPYIGVLFYYEFSKARRA